MNTTAIEHPGKSDWRAHGRRRRINGNLGTGARDICKPGASASAFLADEAGGVGWSLVWTVIFLICGGLAIDGANAWRVRAMLQATADVAAHAGAMQLPSKAGALAETLRIAQVNLPPDRHGEVITADMVEVGRWDAVTRTLDTASPFPNAVRTRAARSTGNGNRVDTFLLRLAGFTAWDVGAESVVQRFIPGCIRNGLVARGWVETSSNNTYRNRICVHGQSGVKLASNSIFEAGVKVTMPDLSDLQMPPSGWTSNVGIADALGEGFLEPRLVSLLPTIIPDLADINSPFQPGYIQASPGTVVDVEEKDWDGTVITAGNVYNVTCHGGNPLTIGGATIERVVIVTNCRVNLDSGLKLYDATIATTNTSAMSFTGSSGVELGRPDDCAAGGGAQLLTLGGVHFAAQMVYHGSEVVAVGDADMAAQVGGINGISVQTGGDINLTSNNSFGLCPGEADQVYTGDYYRLVE